jgi:hypothetical protein
VLQHVDEVSGNVAYGIGRTVFYRWKPRYEKEGLEGLKDRCAATTTCGSGTRRSTASSSAWA